MRTEIYSNEHCSLCSSPVVYFDHFRERTYLRCTNCHSLMMYPGDHVTPEREKERYEEHNNDVEDKGYQEFVMPVVNAVKNDHDRTNKGLDFGSGTGPVISKLLLEDGYRIDKYDPYFHNNKRNLNRKYDYIVCCEVIEHFHEPLKEFRLLKSLLNAEGSLYCMTFLFDEQINFREWYYKNDETHVFFYHRKALKWIKNNIGFSDLFIDGRFIRLDR